jgi:hypothetical protein
MFSRKIAVFSPEAVSLSSDALLGAILKVRPECKYYPISIGNCITDGLLFASLIVAQAAFKASEQGVRTLCLGPLATVQLSMDALFLKQVSCWCV